MCPDSALGVVGERNQQPFTPAAEALVRILTEEVATAVESKEKRTTTITADASGKTCVGDAPNNNTTSPSANKENDEEEPTSTGTPGAKQNGTADESSLFSAE